MIFFINLYFALGVMWHILVLITYSFANAFNLGLKKQNITNPVLRFAFDWIYPEKMTYKIFIGIPVWIILWPVSLIATLIGKQFQNK